MKGQAAQTSVAICPSHKKKFFVDLNAVLCTMTLSIYAVFCGYSPKNSFTGECACTALSNLPLRLRLLA